MGLATLYAQSYLSTFVGMARGHPGHFVFPTYGTKSKTNRPLFSDSVLGPTRLSISIEFILLRLFSRQCIRSLPLGQIAPTP